MPQRFGLREFTPETQTTSGRVGMMAFVLALLGLLLAFGRTNYPAFHTLIELVTVSITWALALLLWNTRRYQDVDGYVVLAYALFLSGGVDLLHMISYQGVNLLGGGGGANTATQYWIIARGIETAGWLGFVTLGNRRSWFSFAIVGLTVMTLAGLASMIIRPVFPVCFDAETGLTPFKITTEYIYVVLLVAALVVYRHRHRDAEPAVRRDLSIALGLVAAAELVFTTYSDAYGFTNMLGHFVRIGSRYMLYLGLVEVAVARPYELFFKRLQQEKKEIAASEERWRLLSATSPDHILDLDQNLVIRFANYPSPGLTMEDLVGRCILDFLPGDERERVEQTLRRALASGEAESYETTYEAPDGGTIHYETTAVGVTVPGARGRHLTLVARNVTDRKRAEAALAETERQLAAILADLPGMVFRSENDGEWTMRFCSEGCKDLTGYGVEELVGNAAVSYASLIHPDDEAMIAEVVGGHLERREQYQATYRIRRRDGVVRWVWEQGHGVFTGDRLDMIEGFIYDVTDLVEAQEKQRAVAQKAVEAQKLESLGVMAGGIAHDFNNLLQTMIGFNELATAETDPDHPAREYLTAVQVAAERASDLTRQMVAFACQGTLTVTEVDISEHLEIVAALLDGAVPKSAIFRRELAPRLPLASVDTSQLDQITLNLVRNAAEALPEGRGTVVLRTGVCHCSEEELAANPCGIHPDGQVPEPGEFVYVEVSDDGTGMDAETVDRLFEPFFTTKFIGRGLGLAAVQGIVRGHRGAVFVNTAPGVGTTIRVAFPSLGRYADPLPGEDDPMPVATPVRECDRYVLIVDDDREVCRYSRMALEKEGYTVVEVASGREAVARVAENPGDVCAVLLDVVMPEMTGEECLRELRRLAPDVPVIVMSGWTEVEVTERFAGQSYQGLLAKPFHTSDLLASISTVIDADT